MSDEIHFFFCLYDFEGFFFFFTPISITQAAGQMFVVGLRSHLSEDEYVKFRARLDQAQIKIVANEKTMEDFHAERDFEETGEGFGSRFFRKKDDLLSSEDDTHRFLCWGFRTFQEKSCFCFWKYSILVYGEDI